jgi:sugar diacid utilization regulator
MTATVPRSVTESASSTIDPDTQARRANDGEPSARVQSDLTVDEDAVDGFLTAEEVPTERLDESVDNVALYAKYRQLAAEQAALRRLATLVARGAEPSEVFDAVIKEMCQCVSAQTVGLWRYNTSGEITLLAVDYRSHALAKWPVGTRIPIDGNTLAAMVQRTGEPAWMDSYENSAGQLATRLRDAGVRAAAGVPVIVDGRVWGLVVVGSVEPGPMPADTEAHISGFAELVAMALVAGYRDEQKRQLLAEPSRRANVIDALLEGRAFDERCLREVAGYLRLPINGPFVVVAAQAPTVGDEPLREIESKLRSLDIFSAWQLLPDVQVGVVHVKSDQQHDVVVGLLSRVSTARVGVSAVFGDLRDTPRALHVARMMLRGPTDSTSSVAVFDGSILTTAAVSAPEAMIRTVGAALDGFGDLPDEDRAMLFETFRVWQNSDASVNAVAERLYCHPNTVRHRLRRIEKGTGRSLSRPRDVAELCLAFEVHRRLM